MEATTARILNAASLLVREQGYEATTMDEIARVAGISRARLYQIFSNRKSLFDGLVADETRTVTGEVMLEMALEPDLGRKIEALVRKFFELADGRRSRRFPHSDPDAPDPELRQTLRYAREALADALSKEIAQSLPSSGRDQALLRAHGVTAMAEGCVVAWMADPQGSRDDAIRLVVALASNALGLIDQP